MVLGGGLRSAVALSQDYTQGLSWVFLLCVPLYIKSITLSDVGSARKRNLTVRKLAISKNMPLLFSHLRRLEAAGRIILQHLSQIQTQPAASAAADSPPSPALMHALKEQAQAKHFLVMRLHAAFTACTDHGGMSPHCKKFIAKADGLEQMLSRIEVAMKKFPY